MDLFCFSRFVLAIFVLVGSVLCNNESPAEKYYKRFDLLDICPRDGSKREISIRSGAGIFRLNPLPGGLAVPLACHLEIEAASSDFGLHVYFEEMNMRDGNDDGCHDYVQFGRDVIYFTTHKSKKFCGQMAKINFSHPNEVYRKYSGSQSRIYVEEKDRELDLWLKVNPVQPNQQPLNLSLVITAFKKGCGKKDLFYRQCHHSSHCVRKEFFCDTYANCAWPSGDVSTDEQKCDGMSGSELSAEEIFSASNIPVIIIVIIVSLSVLIVIVVAVKHFVRTFRKRDQPPTDRTQLRVRSTPSVERDRSPPLLDPERGHPPVAAAPSAPPPYDEAVKDDSNIIHAFPPPYSPTAPQDHQPR